MIFVATMLMASSLIRTEAPMVAEIWKWGGLEKFESAIHGTIRADGSATWDGKPVKVSVEKVRRLQGLFLRLDLEVVTQTDIDASLKIAGIQALEGGTGQFRITAWIRQKPHTFTLSNPNLYLRSSEKPLRRLAEAMVAVDKVFESKK